MKVGKTVGSLADGREIIFFDRSTNQRQIHDGRDLPPTADTAQLRFDPVLGEWVAVATHRQDRTHLPSSMDCPLCPTTDGRPTEVPEPTYEVVVFENRFSSFPGGPAAQPLGPIPAEAIGEVRPAVGRCEVVCFTAEHGARFADLSHERARTVVEAWVDRTTELSFLPCVEEVFCFENRGPEVGVTLHHPHGQIYAYPFVTPRTRQMLASAACYRERTGKNLFAAVLRAEQAAGIRVVTRSEHWTAFVPGPARWPVEVHLYPNRQVPDLPGLTDAERDDFCRLYLDLLRRLDRLYDRPLPYMAGWYQAPTRTERDLAYLHLRLVSPLRAADKLKYLAGSESCVGVFINDLLPEDTAQRLREFV